MPPTGELHKNDKEQAVAIAELRARVKEHSETLERHDKHIKKLDDFMVDLRESLATKDDIQALRSDMRDRIDRSELLDERLDHYRQRIVDLETERISESQSNEAKISRSFNWAILGLFMLEVIVGALQMWEVGRHG